MTKITFVLFNDFYIMNEQKLPDGKTRGGFARLATVVKNERANNRNVIVAHGGDTLSPSLMSGFDRGKHIVALTNMVAPDIFVSGNHEFDFGRDVFLERMGEAKFPLYGANLRLANGEPAPGHKDNAIFDFDGVKLGLTGIAYEKSARLSSPEDLKFLPCVETTKQQAALLRKQGADFVCAVLHCDRGDAFLLQFAQAAELLLTGHTHDLFVQYDGQVAIVESGYDAFFVTCIDIDLQVTTRDGKRLTTWWPKFRVIDTADATPDPEVAAAVARFQEDFSRETEVAIARTEVELDSRNATVRTREAAIGNLFADAMRISMKADAAVINGGGIRSGKVYAPGTVITLKDILAELPFNNRVVVIEMTGAALLEAMENGLAQVPVPAGRFPQVSGIKVVFDPKLPIRKRVLSLEVAGKPVEADKIYRIAILDFLARGGDDYTTFRAAKRVTPDADAPLLANEVAKYLKSLGVVKTAVEGRIVAR
ncbi:MAG: bifunctional metallophosphatase/5'-nucleotidase [Xanthobacteraceae bacterium]|nr:bifunctional metallophosphatase/5'-nucleotidase [Xanthobacteraceae bacterium]MCW5675023.1 bifunctional metallophosphatase/5'-nucleotidase [Xanthobacteraceae bacterium]